MLCIISIFQIGSTHAVSKRSFEPNSSNYIGRMIGQKPLQDLLSISYPRENAQDKIVENTIFRSLLGEWGLSRSITNHIYLSDSGNVLGHVSFTRANDSTNEFNDLLYSEKGTFTTVEYTKFDISKRYIYTLNKDSDEIQIYFPVTEKVSLLPQSEHPGRDYIFVTLKCIPSDSGWTATDYHTCVSDTHKVTYNFNFKDMLLDNIEIRIQVTGPNTDYESITSLKKL